MAGSFKSAVTKFSRPINPRFEWQPRFHDHIIRHRNDFLNKIPDPVIRLPLPAIPQKKFMQSSARLHQSLKDKGFILMVSPVLRSRAGFFIFA